MKKNMYLVPMIGEKNEFLECESLKEAIHVTGLGDSIYKTKTIKIGRINKDGKFIPIKRRKKK